MATLSLEIKEEPKDVVDLPTQPVHDEPSGLDYNAIYGNMYRDFLANNVTNSSDSTRSVSPPSSKVVIPPECYADNVDIQDVVNEFKVTLEKFGVSQRLAAKYIMEDTSQGNLSFLMDKGKRLKWAELSPKGRIPYVKMKQWLDSKEKQISTIEVVKESKAFTRQASNRDAFQRRERFSLFQLTVLCRLFEENPNPTMTTRGAIAEKLSIPSERINVWFQNQRARGFPAKRILQQSFNAASSTNGAARSASIMDSVAMEIVNQSKSDGFLANNTAVVNQYLDNSLTKSEEGINDIHKMLLQYPTDQFQQNVSNSIAVPRSESALISEILGKSDSGNRAIDNRVGTKIKREVESPSPLDKINREMTSDEKVNGYLNHLNQSLSKSTNVTQLDSGGKRKAQTGAAKRKPAFLNKVLPQSQGSLGTPERYTSPYSDPVVTQKNTFNDSSPLSALYRQTASVNFSPPNPSFNYLFDISSPSNLTTRDSNLYGKRLYSPTGSESTKRQSSEVFGELCSDMKRFKADLAAGNDAFQNDKSDSTQNMVTKESSDKEIDKIADQDTRENSTNKEEIKQNGLPKGGNFDDANRALNYTDKTKHTLNGSIAKEMCSTSEPKEDTNELKVNMDTTNREAISTKVSENVTGSTTTAIKFAATDDDSAMRTDENEEFSVNNESLISNTNGLDLSVDQDKNCKRGNDKFVADTGDIDNELSSTYNTDNESLRNKIMSHDIDKPLSKDEMKLFKALYARFVKFHFAQMQFPDIK